MAVEVILFFASIIIVIASSEYYLSFNHFTWDNAETFCKDRCQSNLASIHNDQEMEEINALLINNTDHDSIKLSDNIWFGLNKNESANFVYTDGTPFSYGSDKIIPGIHNQFALSFNQISKTYDWLNIDGNSMKQMFICQQCEWHVIEKFVISHSHSGSYIGATFANGECDRIFSTELASIHSEADMNSLIFLNELANSDPAKSVYIGLDDRETEGVYVWSDQTDLDYQYNTITTNSMSNDCVYMDESANYNWTGIGCAIYSDFNVLCNAPNPLCLSSDDWETANASNWISDSVHCGIYNDNNPLDTYSYRRIIGRNYLWTKLALEYVWKLDLDSDYDSNAYSGIVFSFVDVNSSFSDEYDGKIITIFIGIQVYNGKVYQFIRNKNTLDIQKTEVTQYVNLNYYQRLALQFNESGILYIQLNDEQYLMPQFIGDQIPKNYYIRGITLQNAKVSAWSKSLFYNGWGNRTAEPTASPTKTPTTTKPTNHPISSPTSSPS